MTVVRPRRWSDGTLKPTLPGDFLGIECEVMNPPSARGRTVYVFLDEADVTDLIKELRDEAVRNRSKAMS